MRLIFAFGAFVAGGWLALRSSAIADFVNKAALEFFQIVHAIKEAF